MATKAKVTVTGGTPVKKIRYDKNTLVANRINQSWWLEDENQKHSHIWAKVQAIRQSNSARRSDFLRYARLYTNTEFDHFLSGVSGGFMNRRLSFNVVRSCVDTACSMISQAKTRPLILTTAGDYKQTARAKKLTQYLDGMFDSTKFYRHQRKSFREGCVFGTGILKIFPEEGQVKVEKVFVDEIVVDDLDARAGNPREMHQVKLMPRERLYALFNTKEQRKMIEQAAIWWEVQKSPRTQVDVVGLVESWHLPSEANPDEDTQDGRHVISLNNYTLLDEPYTKNYFPFTFNHWNEPLLGFHGEGLAAQLVGIQLEINMVLQRIKEAQELVAVPRVYVQKGSGVNASHITDEIGGVVYYQGNEPKISTPVAMNKEAYDYLEYLYQKSFQDTGISQLAANSKKPAGLDSAVALREYQDIQSDRFILVGERYQDQAIDAAKIMLDTQRDLAKEDPNMTIKVKGKSFIEKIKWKDVDLDEDKYVMTMYPTNFLPKTPEGQLQFTQELVQAGYIDQQEALSLLNFPDLQGFFRTRTAAIDDINMIIEQIVDEGTYTPPEPYMDLALAIKMMQAAYLRGKTDGVPEDKLELMRRFIDACQDIMIQASAPPPGALTAPPPGPEGPPGPQGPGPQGGPGATGKMDKLKRSDLVPQQQPPQ
jgi:hypothetical protein